MLILKQLDLLFMRTVLKVDLKKNIYLRTKKNKLKLKKNPVTLLTKNRSIGDKLKSQK